MPLLELWDFYSADETFQQPNFRNSRTHVNAYPGLSESSIVEAADLAVGPRGGGLDEAPTRDDQLARLGDIGKRVDPGPGGQG
jgi:hypothetical protein